GDWSSDVCSSDLADSEVVADTTNWYSIAGSGYIRLLMLIVIPLVMASIIQSIINLEKSSSLGKMTLCTIGILVVTAMIAAVIGIGSATLFDLNADQIEAGQAEMERTESLENRLGTVEDMTIPDQIVSFIPSNIFLHMTQQSATSVIAVAVFSIIVGVAVLGLRMKNPEQAEFV